MLNTKDYTVIINGEEVKPIKRNTFVGTALEYTTSNGKYVCYMMDQYEASHANESAIINHVKSEVRYKFM